ncbi:MAG: GNAT family N-acetyltransferase [Rhodocyclaceae bacterium]|jgi:N-acetylglutamate synthase-like GNAT family acetyltransferase|nr:GNAT family N-acetyltransferase [Rhodocyclaceae bacterium]
MVNATPATLRKASVDDAAAIADLAVQLGYPVTVSDIVERLSKLPEDTEAVVVATIAGVVRAWMQVGVALSIESAPFAEIRGLVVDANLRSSGVGSQLVAFAQEWALTKHVASLRVRSNTVRTATHAFYQKRGFSVGKEQKVFVLALPQTDKSRVVDAAAHATNSAN